jgi:lipopolysaccharide biosynthesis glycosyltransferase
VKTVALFADRRILPGLHVTLASLLAHSRETPPFRIVVFGEGLSAGMCRLLRATVEPRLGSHRFEIREFVLPSLGRAKSLRGNYTTYGRLFLPGLLEDADTCVYLDCDLIVARPIDGLLERGDRDAPLHAEGSGLRRTSIDHPTFKFLGLSQDQLYFNCGVLVFNLARWRRDQLSERCLRFADEHGARLFSADQTVLNALFGDEVEVFGSEFNTFLWPNSPSVDGGAAEGRILHFVGAPKPWDYLGSYANRNAALWNTWVEQTAWRHAWLARAACYWSVRQRSRILPASIRACVARARGGAQAA